MRYLLSFLTLFIICSIQGQNTVGLLSINSELISDGYNLIFPHNQSTVFLLNNCGQIVHSWQDSDKYRPGNSVYLNENGDLIRCKRLNNSINDPIWAGGGGDIVEILSWENVVKFRFALNDSLQRLHHDVAPMPNGNILMLAWEKKSMEETLGAGRDPLKLSMGELWPEFILEWNPELDSIVWEWHVWDHLVQDFDSTKNNYGVVGEHHELVDINYDEHDGHPDWMHMNAIDYNPVLDQIMMSNPYFNEIWIIDHSTSVEEAASNKGGKAGKGGDLLFRWGNPKTYQSTDTVQQLFFQHDVHWVNPFAGVGEDEFGQILLFNNRVGSTSSNMLLLESRPDSSFNYPFTGTKFSPQDPTRVFTHPNDDVRSFSNGLSSVQLLPNGNLLTIAGRWGYAFEQTIDNEIVWEYIVPLFGGDPVSQGDTLGIGNNITFRMHRYSPDFPGFSNKDLSAKGYIELNPDTSFCDMLTPVLEVSKDFQVSVYPIPFTKELNIQSLQKKLQEMEIMNMQGQTIYSYKTELGVHQHTISTEFWQTGFYFLRVDDEVMKLVKY